MKGQASPPMFEGNRRKGSFDETRTHTVLLVFKQREWFDRIFILTDNLHCGLGKHPKLHKSTTRSNMYSLLVPVSLAPFIYRMIFNFCAPFTASASLFVETDLCNGKSVHFYALPIIMAPDIACVDDESRVFPKILVLNFSFK